MIVLGIDPGTKRVGYGVVESKGSATRLLDAGILTVTGASETHALVDIKSAIRTLLATWKPDVCGIEKLYFAKNRTTGIAVAQGRGVIISEVLERGISLREFSPNEVKLLVAGHGGADKRAVAKMVRLILHEPSLDVVDDASDAIAIALCACTHLDTRREYPILSLKQ